ncbi:hypothetical protein INT45_000781 [Circinella minor]|uniref:Ndc10 domain-containing protein n=1 Tax=Circinella minor TaxID=1195481 RepID=A0A8H7RXE8_9FUNG|nr:hypothetical protein INT45_000781 [Circinella minor]
MSDHTKYHPYLCQIYTHLSEDSSSQLTGSSNGQSSHAAHQLNIAMQESRRRTQRTTQQLTPDATKRTYYPKMDEFIRWCDDKGYPLATRYQVDGDKLHFFLEESVSNTGIKKVIGRKRRPTNPKRRIIDDDSTTVEEEVEAYVISFSSIEQYVSAVVLLFHDQCRLNLNVPTNHPRIPDVKTLLKNERKKETRRRKENYADRVAGSILNGYSTTDELTKVVDYFLTKDRPEHYRNAVMFLASHFGLMRGGNVCEIELADVHYIPLQGEGPNPEVECPCLILLMDHGKTNQFGKQEHASAIRCGHVEICLWMTLGIYFFHRWHISGEQFPDMTRPEEWYTIKLFKSGATNDLKTAVSHDAHYKAFKKAFDDCHIKSTSITHAGRKSGAKMADLGDAGASDIRRAGRWTNDSMEGSYLTNLPRRMLRVMASFDPNGKTFYLPRASVSPPSSLQRKVFPWVEEWQTKIDQGQGDQSVAADGFLKMLQILKVTFLQDSVMMIKRHPRLSIWSAPLFNDPEYLAYKS